MFRSSPVIVQISNRNTVHVEIKECNRLFQVQAPESQSLCRAWIGFARLFSYVGSVMIAFPCRIKRNVKGIWA